MLIWLLSRWNPSTPSCFIKMICLRQNGLLIRLLRPLAAEESPTCCCVQTAKCIPFSQLRHVEFWSQRTFCSDSTFYLKIGAFRIVWNHNSSWCSIFYGISHWLKSIAIYDTTFVSSLYTFCLSGEVDKNQVFNWNVFQDWFRYMVWYSRLLFYQ